jgi:hypothetical protein
MAKILRKLVRDLLLSFSSNGVAKFSQYISLGSGALLTLGILPLKAFLVGQQACEIILSSHPILKNYSTYSTFSSFSNVMKQTPVVSKL